MSLFPLPPTLSTRGIHAAPSAWGCHACGAALTRATCCQRATCWQFDARGEATPGVIDEPCDIPPAHCQRCCAAAAPATIAREPHRRIAA